MRIERRSLLILILFVLPFCAAEHGLAQSATAKIFGSVFDGQQRAVPGASIQVRDVNTGVRRVVLSSDDGYYEVTNLLPGELEVSSDIPGFAPVKIALTLAINQQLRLDLNLKIAGLAESTLVEAATPLINSQNSTLGTVIDQQKMNSMPLNGRQFLELALLTPGVHTSHGAQMGDKNALYWRPGQNSALSVGGGRSNTNNFLLDGTTNTDPTFNTYVISLSPDAIREFQTQNGTYSAEFGSAGTGVINVVTRSGTNQLHGSLYEYLRNSVFDAREFTSRAKLPHFAHNQFGGTIGGPIRKNRTHYFGHYEGFRMVQAQSNILTVPLMPERRGDFTGRAPIFDPATTRLNPDFDSSKPASPTNPRSIRSLFPLNVIPQDRINPISLRVLSEFVPAPTDTASLSNNYSDNRSQRLNNDQFTVRLDHIFNEKSNLFGRYSLSSEGGFTPENLPGFGSFHDNRVQNLSLSYTLVASATRVNDLRVGVQRMTLLRVAENGRKDRDLVRELGITGVGFGGKDAYGLPQFSVQGYNPFGDSLLATPVSYFNTMYQVGDTFTWTSGRHSLKFGGDIRRFGWNMLGFFQNRGFFSFTRGFTTRTASNDGTGDALASFLLGLPVVATRQAGLPTMNMRQTGASLFVHDDWRVHPKLTLNLGLRYEIVTPLRDIRKVLSNLDFVDGKPVAYLGGQGDYPKGLQFTDRNDFAPRLGFAYAPGANFVVRGGYGVFYAMHDMNTWCNQVHNVPLVFPETNQSDNFVPAINRIGFGPAILGTTVVAFTGVDPRSRTGYIQQFSLTLEKQLAKHDMVQAAYFGSVGRKLQRAHLLNNATPAPGPLGPRRPFRTISFLGGSQLPENIDFQVQSLTFPVSAINVLENSAKSSYNAGWLLWNHQWSKSLSLLAHYTFSRNLTDAPAFRSPALEPELPQNNSDLDAEWGLAGCDVKHRFVLSTEYTVPIHAGGEFMGSRWAANVFGDWRLAAIYQMQSGFPFTVSVFGDTANAGSILNAHPVRANQVSGAPVSLASGLRSGDKWFNTDAFTTPPAFTFGNVGRNTVGGPALNTCDFSLIRDVKLRENAKVQFRAEFFNLFNHTNYDTPERFVNTPQFGSVTSAAVPARQIQFALRVMF